MAKVTMLNMAGAEAGQIELNDAIFAVTPNEFAVHAEEADASLSDRKEQAVTDRDIQQTHHRLAEV